LNRKIQFGLIGKNIDYSFSKKFFTNKFKNDLKYSNYEYLNYDLTNIDQINNLFENKNIAGLNVTIPYKEKVLNYLDKISEEAKQIGSVNTICFESGQRIGYNTDIYGFSETIKTNKLNNFEKGIILGTGGVSKTVSYYFQKNNIDYKIVSRKRTKVFISYEDLNNEIFDKVLIVNCTPLGTFPEVNSFPNLPYNKINKTCIFFDLVYNPSETLFLKKGKMIGCNTVNGLKMLEYQANKSFELWLKTIN
jgi:shikimate dehydrogenase